MKRQVSISIFCAIFLVILVWLYIKFYNETKIQERDFSTERSLEEQEEAISIGQIYTSYDFYIKDEYGKIVVYTTKNQELYMETSISTNILPLDIQEKIKTGIFFETEAELYDFLESYSS